MSTAENILFNALAKAVSTIRGLGSGALAKENPWLAETCERESAEIEAMRERAEEQREVG